MVNKKQVSKGILFLLGMIFLVLPMINAQEWGNLSVGLQAYYKLDEKSGVNVTDSSVNGNNAIASNVGLWTNESGVINTSANFSGNDNTWKIDIPSVEMQTISMWIYYKGHNSGNDESGYLWDGRDGIGGYIYFGGMSAEWTSAYINNESILTTNWINFWANSSNWNKWNHVVIERNVATGISEFGRRYQTVENSGGNMSLDEIGIWNRSLTSDEISSLYLKTPYGFIPSISVILNSPTDYYYSSSETITFNCSSQDTALLNLTLMINGIDNITVYNTTADQNLSLQTDLRFLNGDYNWSCKSSNRDIWRISTTQYFNVFLVIPELLFIGLTSPTPNQTLNTSNSVTFNCTGVNPIILNLTLNINGNDTFSAFNTTANQTKLNIYETYVLPNGDYNWSCYGSSIGLTNSSRVQSFNVSYIPPIPSIPTPTPETPIYSVLVSAGAGLGLFIQFIAVALPFLIIPLILIGIIVIIGFAVANWIKNFKFK